MLMPLLVVAACGDDPVRPEPIEGAGIRFVFEDAVPVIGGVRVELWRSSAVAPPTCLVGDGAIRAQVSAEAGALALLLAPAQPDSCTRGTYVIRNILGDTVRAVADESWEGRAPSWNKISDDGRYVPSGIYPIRWQCLDSANPFIFEGHYYVYGPDEVGSCSWLIWSDLLDLSGARSRFEFTGFPESLTILTVVPGTEDAQSVAFSNPYLLRVHVPDRPLVQKVVTLEEGSFTEVRVSLSPAS
jgi:hypothetical protein